MPCDLQGWEFSTLPARSKTRHAVSEILPQPRRDLRRAVAKLDDLGLWLVSGAVTGKDEAPLWSVTSQVAHAPRSFGDSSVCHVLPVSGVHCGGVGRARVRRDGPRAA